MTSRLVPAGSRTWPPKDEPKPTRRLLKLAVFAALAATLWLGAALLYSATRPAFGPATLLLPGEGPRQFAYPFRLRDAPRTKFVLIQQLELTRFHPTTFVFYPKDFLWAVSVNGHDVLTPGLPLSAASHEGRSIDLGAYLHPGSNVIALQMEVRWGDARFQIGVSPWDKYEMALLALVVGATFATAAFIYTFLGANLTRLECLLLLAGIVLRYLYFFGTPYFIRSYDYWGHADYLDFVIQHFRQPPTSENWEAFQPPLYYLLVGGITKLLLLFGVAEDQRYLLWQIVSLLFSVGVLAAGYVIANILYERGDRGRFYMLAVFAVAPPLVFNASRIGNDSLLALLSYVWLALLLRYWREPDRAGVVRLAITLGLALLTKANAISLVMVTTACLLCDQRVEVKARRTSVCLMLAICGVIAGWYYLPRAFQSHEFNTYVVGNLHSLNHRAYIDRVFLKSVIFNPFKVVRYPFDETWGPRNDYFLEVFFKTALLGEWINGVAYKWLARWMVVVALLLIPPLVVGLWRAVKRRSAEEWPLLITLATVFLAQWIFLQFAPYLSTQDFRFSVVLLVPFVYFFLEGVNGSSSRVKVVATFLLQIALVNSAIYLLVLAM